MTKITIFNITSKYAIVKTSSPAACDRPPPLVASAPAEAFPESSAEMSLSLRICGCGFSISFDVQYLTQKTLCLCLDMF